MKQTGRRAWAAPPVGAAPPLQPATLRPGTAAVTPPSPDGGRPRRDTAAASLPPSAAASPPCAGRLKPEGA